MAIFHPETRPLYPVGIAKPVPRTKWLIQSLQMAAQRQRVQTPTVYPRERQYLSTQTLLRKSCLTQVQSSLTRPEITNLLSSVAGAHTRDEHALYQHVHFITSRNN
jgi:hypothetical protein